MPVQCLGHPKSAALEGVEKGTHSRNVSLSLCSEDQTNGAENGQIKLFGFRSGSRVVQNHVRRIKLSSQSNDFCLSRIYGPAQ